MWPSEAALEVGQAQERLQIPFSIGRTSRPPTLLRDYFFKLPVKCKCPKTMMHNTLERRGNNRPLQNKVVNPLSPPRFSLLRSVLSRERRARSLTCRLLNALETELPLCQGGFSIRSAKSPRALRRPYSLRCHSRAAAVGCFPSLLPHRSAKLHSSWQKAEGLLQCLASHCNSPLPLRRHLSTFPVTSSAFSRPHSHPFPRAPSP
jgi:hypothetical protein